MRRDQRGLRVGERVVDRRRLRQPGDQRRLREVEVAARASRSTSRRPPRRRRRGCRSRPCSGRSARIFAFDHLSLSLIARHASLIFRSKVCSRPVYMLRTSCWVIVEPPSTTLPALEIGPERARDPDVVDAAVLVEALVLDGDGRLRQPGAHPLQRDRARGCGRRGSSRGTSRRRHRRTCSRRC